MSLNLGLLTGVLTIKPHQEQTRGSPIVVARLRVSEKAGKGRTETFEVPFEAFYDEVKAGLLAMNVGDGLGIRIQIHVYNGKSRESGEPYDKIRVKAIGIEFHWPASVSAAGQYPKPKTEEPDDATATTDAFDASSAQADGGAVY